MRLYAHSAGEAPIRKASRGSRPAREASGGLDLRGIKDWIQLMLTRLSEAHAGSALFAFPRLSARYDEIGDLNLHGLIILV